LNLEFVAGAESVARRKPRDPPFRLEVTRACEYRCCVCELGLRMDDATMGLEAAHIMWHQAGGPDETPNGLSLCALHHKLFDRGAFTVEEGDLVVLVSEQANGSGLEEALLRHHRTPIRVPQRESYYPAGEYLEWHRREVFRGRERDWSSPAAPVDATGASDSLV